MKKSFQREASQISKIKYYFSGLLINKNVALQIWLIVRRNDFSFIPQVYVPTDRQIEMAVWGEHKYLAFEKSNQNIPIAYFEN